MTIVAFTIRGEPASKANQRKMVMVNRKGGGKRPAFIKSDKARAWADDALLQIPPHVKLNMPGDLVMFIRVFYATELPDLDESVVLDVLQAKFTKGAHGEKVMIRAGVYLNDRQVRERHVWHRVDKYWPRVEIIVAPIEEAGAAVLWDGVKEKLPAQLAGMFQAHGQPVKRSTNRGNPKLVKGRIFNKSNHCFLGEFGPCSNLEDAKIYTLAEYYDAGYGARAELEFRPMPTKRATGKPRGRPRKMSTTAANAA